MLIVLLEVLNPAGEFAVDYLQDSAPAMVLSVTPVAGTDGDVYLVRRADPAGSDDTPLRIEQSDLYAHEYVVFPSDAPPMVLSLSGVRRELGRVGLDPDVHGTRDLVFQPPAAAEGPDDASAAPIGGPLYLLVRNSTLLLAAPSEGAVLVTR